MTASDLVGVSATELPARGRVRLTGPGRVVDAGRQLVTPVDCRSVARV
ncbi:MAG TPA: hypothetical protein VE617_01175 [Propionibacteriaceae bacterium]|nr:hypothetical protein [Propionibacteriaceae bacterium]